MTDNSYITTNKSFTINGGTTSNPTDNIKPSTTEIRKGKWEWSLADNGWADHKCSACGFTINTDIHVHVDYPVCPKCGAVMDETRAFYNPKKTMFERVRDYITALKPLELMCVYNQYLKYSHSFPAIIAPMSMFNYIMKDYLQKTYLEVADLVDGESFDSRDIYFYCDRYTLLSSNELIGDLITDEELYSIVETAICECIDYNDCQISSYLRDMAKLDPLTMDWNTYLKMSKGENT